MQYQPAFLPFGESDSLSASSSVSWPEEAEEEAEEEEVAVARRPPLSSRFHNCSYTTSRLPLKTCNFQLKMQTQKIAINLNQLYHSSLTNLPLLVYSIFFIYYTFKNFKLQVKS